MTLAILDNLATQPSALRALDNYRVMAKSYDAKRLDAACRRGERCLYFAFEESRNQIIRNMRSIGIDLEQWVAGVAG